MNLWNETKSIPISKDQVWEAYKRVRANNGSAGVDGISMDDYDANCSKHLYKLWNRKASGSYFPPAVKEVEMPKANGKVRKLGIPTISDRVAQMVVKMYLEPRFEKIFNPNFYGYRPNKSAHQALSSVRQNCRKTDWVIDLDIKGFFDNINHDKLMKAVHKHVPEKWARMYITRWLTTPIEKKTGRLFLGFDCAISINSRKRISDKLEELNIIDMSFKSLVGIAQKLNSYIRGWVNYYGKFRGSELSKVFYLLRCRLVRWIRKRYKRYRNSLNKAYACLDRIRKQFPYLFYHWQVGYSN